VLGAETFEVWVAWMAGWSAWWVFFAVLQARWWRTGHTGFWRPIYAYTLFGSMAILVLPLFLLLIPSFRRWLSGKMKPYDPPNSRAPLEPGKELEDAGWFLERGATAQDAGAIAP
jgi:hypothetical protein